MTRRDRSREEVKVLVRVEPGYDVLGFLVLSDSTLHLLAVPPVVRPGGVQIGLAQIGVSLEDFGIRQPELSPFDEAPDRVTGVANASRPAADALRLLDPRSDERRPIEHDFSGAH